MRVNTKLSTYEVFALTNILIALIITDSTPSIIAQNTKNAFWYVPLISFMIMLPPLLILLYLLSKYNAEHLVDLFEILLGKFLGKTFAFLIFIINFLLMAFDNRSYVEQIKILYFSQSSSLIIFVFLTFVCVFGAIRGIKVIGYTAKILLPYIMISFAFLIILILPSIVPERILPIFGSGLSNVLEEGFLKGSLFSKFSLLLMIIPSVREPKAFYKGGLIGLLVSVVQIILFFFLYATFFDYNSVTSAPFHFHEITQYIRLGEFFTNIETFFLIFWLLAMFIRFILILYLISWLFGSIFNIKNFELLILPIGFLSMVVGLLPDNPSTTEMFFRDRLLNITTPFVIFYSLFLLMFHFFKKRKERSR